MQADEGRNPVSGTQTQGVPRAVADAPEAYAVPAGSLRLSGPVARPAPGTLPLRGDLAHIALAEWYLVQNYVCPAIRFVGGRNTALHLQPGDGADIIAPLGAGDRLELLDEVGAWGWVCLGPDGPSGYVPLAMLA